MIENDLEKTKVTTFRTHTSMAWERLANTLSRTFSSIQAATSGGRVIDHCSRTRPITTPTNVLPLHIYMCNTLMGSVTRMVTQAPLMKVVDDVSQKARKALTSFITVLNIVRDARRIRDGGACVRARVCVRVPKIVSLPRGCARSDCESKQGIREYDGSEMMSQMVLTMFDGLVDGIVRSKPSTAVVHR